MTDIRDAKIQIIATNSFAHSEPEVPHDKLRKHGATVHVATPNGNAITSWCDGGRGGEAEAALKNAGGHMFEWEVAVDHGIVTSRQHGDLNDFVANIVEEIEEGGHGRQAA